MKQETATIPYIDLAFFVNGYLECASWLGAYPDQDDWNGNANDIEYDWSIDDLEFTSLQRIEDDCKRFIKENRADLEDALRVSGYTEVFAGHDFCLTRNGHGTGFWDRGLGVVGDRLSEAARKFGAVTAFVNKKHNGAIFFE